MEFMDERSGLCFPCSRMCQGYFFILNVHMNEGLEYSLLWLSSQ